MRGQTTYTFKRIEKTLRRRRQRDKSLPYCAACGEEIGTIVYRNSFYDPLCRVCFENPDIREKNYLEERKEKSKTQSKPQSKTQSKPQSKTQSKPQSKTQESKTISFCPDKDLCKHASDVSKTCNSNRKAYEKCRFLSN